MKFNILILYEKVLKDFRKTVYFMQEHGILHTRLRCPDRQCSIFEDTKVPILKLLPHLLLCTPSRLIGTAGHDTGHNFAPRTHAYYIGVLRRLVCDDLLEHKKPIGGPGLTVQIDETMVYRRKNHKGRIVPQDWVLVGVCVETKESFMCHVGNRTADELYEGCRDWINSQSHIITDCWRTYPEVARSLQASSHQMVNHSSNFVDPKTGACTNRVEGLCPCSSAGYANATASPEQENARPLHGRVPLATIAQERRSLRSIARDLQEAREC